MEQFRALRTEILLRIPLRSQLVAFAVTSFAAIIALTSSGTFPREVLFVYPIMAFFIAYEWMDHDLKIFGIASYIKQQIEPHFPTLRWEHHLDHMRKRRKLRTSRVSAGGIFVCASLLSLGLALGDFVNLSTRYGGWLWVPVGLDLMALVGCIIALRARRVDPRNYFPPETISP
jgi:hypothetical protein